MKDTAPHTRFYNFHGVRIGCSSGEAVAAALHGRLGCLPEDGCGPCDLTFNYRSVAPGEEHRVERAPAEVRPIYDSSLGDVLYSDASDKLYISSQDHVRLTCDPERGCTRISVAAPARDQLWLLTHPLFTIPLVESLKRRGRYCLHAAGVAIEGKGVLFPGASGSGKSTLALALVRSGLAFLGDDMLFVAHGRFGLRALAFPEPLDLTDATVRLFPELHDMLERPRLAGSPKHQVRADERYRPEIAWECRPVALVFPRVANADDSVLTPMDRGEALLELAPNILLTDSASSQAHLDTLADLVATCGCYRLETGRDLNALAARLRGLVEEHS